VAGTEGDPSASATSGGTGLRRTGRTSSPMSCPAPAAATITGSDEEPRRGAALAGVGRATQGSSEFTANSDDGGDQADGRGRRPTNSDGPDSSSDGPRSDTGRDRPPAATGDADSGSVDLIWKNRELANIHDLNLTIGQHRRTTGVQNHKRFWISTNKRTPNSNTYR
jgi:hypothetical protein